MATKNPRTKVISFRLTNEQHARLTEECASVKTMGVKTPQQLARKLTLDFLVGWLTYKKADHRRLDYDVVMSQRDSA